MGRTIDADALVNELHKHFSKGFDGDEWWNSTHVLTAIEQAPTVDAAPVRHGRWKKAERNGMWAYSDAYRQCSECKDVIYLAFKMQYCPTCGAKMDAERSEE